MALFTMRFRRHPDGMKDELIEASTLEKAYQTAERWCEMESERSGSFQSLKLIGVAPAVVATEEILNIARPAPPEPEQVIMRPTNQEQLERISARNIAERAVPNASPTQPQEPSATGKPEGIWDKVRQLGK